MSDATTGGAELIERVPITVTINGSRYDVEVEPRRLLVTFLRDDLGLTGAHVGCVVGRCGACTVLWNGRPVKSCMVLAVQTDGTQVTTVEGLADDEGLHALQEAFWEHDAAECGYCTPGMLMSGCGLLQRVPNPTEAEIKEAISGNLCRCTGYFNIINAIKASAGRVPPATAGDGVAVATGAGEGASGVS